MFRQLVLSLIFFCWSVLNVAVGPKINICDWVDRHGQSWQRLLRTRRQQGPPTEENPEKVRDTVFVSLHWVQHALPSQTVLKIKLSTKVFLAWISPPPFGKDLSFVEAENLCSAPSLSPNTWCSKLKYIFIIIFIFHMNVPLLCLPDFSRANLCLVCPVIWHSRWELVQICWENFSQPLLAILYRLLAPCNASVSHSPQKTLPWWKKVGMQLRERNWQRYWFLAIRWNCASDNKTLRGAMRAPLQTKKIAHGSDPTIGPRLGAVLRLVNLQILSESWRQKIRRWNRASNYKALHGLQGFVPLHKA